MSSSALNLSNLPPDIIRKVVKVGLESVNSMLLISRGWNNLAFEILSFRKRLPVIYIFDWDLIDIGCWDAEITILNKFNNYFGVDKWYSEPGTKNMVRVRNDFSKKTIINKRLKKQLSWFFNRCSMIERFKLDICFNDKINVIRDALKGIYVRKLYIRELNYLSKNYLTTILKFIPSLTIKRLEIYVKADTIRDLQWNSHKKDIANFFTRASKMVPSITLKIEYFPEIFTDTELMDYWKSKVNSLPNSSNFIATVAARLEGCFAHICVNVAPIVQ